MKSLVPVLLLVLAAPALGEVVHLNDGTTLEGDLQRTGEGWLVTAADGKVTVVTPSQVKSIEFKKGGTSAGDSADQGLASLRRAVASQNDVPRIIERFKSFIAQNPNTPASKEAAQDLATWQDRRDKGLVRAGDQWVSKEKLAELQSQARAAAASARTLIGSGKVAEAAAMIEKALAVSPQNAGLLYLKGVTYNRQGQIVPARTAFQAAEAADPQNAATHNNIAVILWKQHAPVAALAEYDKAMSADPQNLTILDNVHEALHALPPEFKDKDVTKRAREHFADQDAALQRTMAAKGQYRWGSQWLDEREYNRIQAQQKAVQDRIDSMQKDFDGIQATIMKLDRDIQSDVQIAQSLASQAVQMDPTTGRTYSLPLPQRYYDLQKDIASMKSERVLRQRQLEDLQKLAAQQKKTLPQEKFTGLQKPFDVDATPGFPTTPTTLSASASSLQSTGAGTAPPLPSPTTAPAPPTSAPAPPAVAAPPASTPPPTPSTGGADFGPATPRAH